MSRRLVLVLAFVLVAASAAAQPPRVTADQGTGGSSAWKVDFGAGALHIICDSGCGSPPASADGTAFVAGTTNVSLIGAAFNDALAALSSGTYAAPRLTAYRALHINIRDAAGLVFGTTANPFSVQDAFGGHALTDAELRASPPTVAITSAAPIEVTGVAGAAVGVAITDSGNAVIGQVKITDGSFIGTVKTASTLPALSDTALVTTQRDPLPAGTNVLGHVINDASSAVIGHVINDASSAVIGHVIVDSSGVLHVIIDSSAALAVTGPLTDTQLRATAVPISGTVTVTQATGTNLHMVADSGTITTVGAVTAITNALPSGTNVIGHVITDAASVVAATLAAETTKVIGTVNIAAAQAIQANAGTNLNTSLLALESGGNLATEATNTTALANATGITNTALPTRADLIAGGDPSGLTRVVQTTATGVLLVQASSAPSLPLPPCNPVRRTYCAAKGF